MSRHSGLYQWANTVSTYLPHLSRPQALVLAMWSYGMVLARSCGLTAVTSFLAPLLSQRLREWYYDAKDKRGHNRLTLEVETCFLPLLRWIIAWWQGSQLALALDSTALGDRFVVLALSVVYRGCAIPVAWTVLVARMASSP